MREVEILMHPVGIMNMNLQLECFSNYIITALWLRDELNEQEFNIINKYIKKNVQEVSKANRVAGTRARFLSNG